MHSNFNDLRTRNLALGAMNTSTFRAVVAAHAAAAVAPTQEGATPAVAASAPLIGVTALAPALELIQPPFDTKANAAG